MTLDPASADLLIPFADRLFIGGDWVKPSTSDRFALIMPSTEELFGHVAEAQQDDVHQAVSAARTAFDNGPWPRMSPSERAAHLRAIADALAAKIGDASRIWTSEMGVVHGVSQYITSGMPDILRFYAAMADDYPFIEQHPSSDGGKGLLVREPVGVVAAIVPWNAALMLALYKVAPALLAGCTVILKASPEAPGALYLLAEAIREANLPAGVFNMITADRAVSEQLVRHPGVDKVSFTGSSAVGKTIASICGERVARFTLELGGKSAAVICDDADLQKVAEAITNSTTLMTNQVCAALSRVIVPRARHDAMVEALDGAFRSVKVGDPFDPATQMGPLAMARQRDRVEAYIAKGVSDGATLATGGKRAAGMNRGFFIEPTVFGNVDNDSTIAQEEIFGPVVAVIPAENEDHAVELANDSVFGLNSAVFSNDPERVYRMARRLRAGTVGQNGFRPDFTIAFGGFKQSGIGREGGREGLAPYLETKTIVMDQELAGL